MPTFPMRIRESSREIPFFFGQDLWIPLLDYLREHFPAHQMYLICDDQVGRLYAETARQKLSSLAGFQEVLYFPAGEASKSVQYWATLQDALLLRRAGRDTLLLAMGGGVTGDLAGFVAATLHRGVPLIHLPTTLLAMVDSSIGGKVGINHPAGKNLLGAFYQPGAVFCDLAFLKTLPEEEFLNGLAEVLKYAAVMDAQLWSWLAQDSEPLLRRGPEVLEKIIFRCAKLKAGVVEADEKENGYRSILNFGHTVGHALEKLSGYSLKHGFAVAAGMRAAARLSRRLLGYPQEAVAALDQMISTYRLDRVDFSKYDPARIWEALHSDKKARGGRPRFTLLKAPQEPQLFHPVSAEELQGVLREM